jgi:hypothetical protein
LKPINMIGWINRNQKKKARKGPRRLLNQRRRHKILIKKLLKKPNQSPSNLKNKEIQLILRRKRSHNKMVKNLRLRELNKNHRIMTVMAMRRKLRLKVKAKKRKPRLMAKEKIPMVPNQAQIHRPKSASPKKRHSHSHKKRRKIKKYSILLLIHLRECLKQLMMESP